MRKYHPLEKDDLIAITYLLDHEERNTRNRQLSWIWAVDVGGDTESSEWLTESK